MADYDDAQSPMGEDEAPSRGHGPVRDRVGGPIGRAMAWFNEQPAQTKILVLGVIVVGGVVVWMMFRKKPTQQQDMQATSDAGLSDRGAIPKPGDNGPGGIAQEGVGFSTLPANGPGGVGTQPSPPGVTPGNNGPTGIATQPAVAPAVARWRITPGGVSKPYANYNPNNAGHRQTVSTTGSLN